MTITAICADITTLAVDAIVNASNSSLQNGAGVNGAIHAAATPRRLSDACAELKGCAPGDAKATPGFGLPARFIVHTVGPVWHGGTSGEVETLASCYRRSVEVARSLGARSISFPAISTGIFGFPPEKAAVVAVRTLEAVDDESMSIVLCAFDQATLALYQSLLRPPGPG